MDHSITQNTDNKPNTNRIYIFVVGAIYSGIGKGVFTASLAKLLENLSYKVLIKKIDGYLNLDAGTINPNEHGEVFVTADGQEGDMDLGTYERFMSYETVSDHITTLGRIIFNTLMKEREGQEMLGKTVEYLHVEKNIKKYIQDNDPKYEIVICEMGGVIGDDSNTTTLRAINKIENKIVICLSYCLWLENAKEYKAKPTIIALQTLSREYGINPDLFVMRSHKLLEQNDREHYFRKLEANFDNWQKKENVIFIPDLSSSYLIYNELISQHNTSFLNKLNVLMSKKFPEFYKKNVDSSKALKYGEITEKVADYEKISKESVTNNTVKIALVGKYDLYDSYSSVFHSITHAAAYLNIKVHTQFLKADTFPPEEIKNYDGLIVPGGFGYPRTDALQDVIGFVRKNDIAYLGICFGMQLAFLEGLNNVCNIKATSSEFYSEAPELVKTHVPAVDLVENWKKDWTSEKVTGKIGGSMRLGTYTCEITPDTKAMEAYGANTIFERHRHRYEINQEYISIMEKNGYVFSGICAENKLVEILEYKPNKFFLASQFHPEFKSKIEKPHPLFLAFIKNAAENKHKQIKK